MKKPKEIDIEKTYARIVKFYVDKKGYPTDRANEIAQREIERQLSEGKTIKQERLD